MKTLEALGITLGTWTVDRFMGTVVYVPDPSKKRLCCDGDMVCMFTTFLKGKRANAKLCSAAPEMYESLRECCDEAMGDGVPRCYACRKDDDGHCSAMKRGCCHVWNALIKAGGAE